MIMRSAKVPLSPSSALQTMYFCVGLGVAAHRLPLDAGGEARAAAAAQAAIVSLLRRSRAGPIASARAKPFIAVMGAVIVERTRIDDAAAGEGRARLRASARDLLGQRRAQRMNAAVSGRGTEQARFDIGRRVGP